jgi:diguanylate cyclase (GGDEF)-like protein
VALTVQPRGDDADAHGAIRAMLQNLDSAVSSYSVRERRYLYLSAAAERIFGAPHGEFDGTDRVWRRVVHPDDAAVFFAARERLLRDGGAAQLDYRVVHADGRVRWIHHSANSACGDDGTPARIDSVATDVTEAFEQRLQLQRLSRIRAMLSAVNTAIVRTEEPDAVCRDTCEIATRLGGLPGAGVVLFDAETVTTRIAAIVGDLSYEVLEGHARRTLHDPEHEPGVVATSMRMQRPAVENDIEPALDDVPDRRRIFQAGVRSVASFPFRIDAGRSGTLVLASYERGFFRAEEIELLSSLAINLGFALELATKRRRLDYLAYYDPLTELPNRTLALDRLGAAIAAANGSARVALMLIDLRGFAALNSTLGHAAGDEILRALARRLVETVGAMCAARVGADRFAIIVQKLHDVRDVLRALGPGGLAMLSAPIQVAGRELRITAHVGCAMYPDDGDDANALFRAADAALQAAKAMGAAYRFYSRELDEELRNRVELEGRLRRAAAEEQFVLYYQPKVELTNRRITGVEALIRWRDPARDGALVPPIEFIPALEHMGLIVDVGRWALREAARQCEAWRSAALEAPRVAVNVSAVQLRSAQFLTDVEEAIAPTQGGCGLDIEVTESAVMHNVRLAVDVLREIGLRGVGVAMDDFGTGYSSLSQLFQLPIGSLKIDRSFIHGFTTDEAKRTIVSTVISLARQLRLNVVAEGVETEEQAELLHALGCDEAQGFLFGRPMPADDLACLLPKAASP